MNTQKRKQEILELFDEIVDAYKQLSTMRSEEVAFEEMSEPKKPIVVEDVDTWFEYLSAQMHHEEYSKQLRLDIRAQQRYLHDLKSKFTGFGLGRRIWYKHGEWGIGVSHSNLGGSPLFALEVRPWKDEMPSLDYGYIGD